MRTAGGALEEAKGAQRRVAPFMLAALASLLLGLWAGLARIGWELPEADASLMLRHGGLMVVGFVATLIAVERAVAVRSPIAFAAPALSAAAGIVLITGVSDRLPPALAAAAGVAYSLNVAVLLYEHRQPVMALSLVGGVCLAIAGVVWWDGGSVRTVVPWWMAFLVFTIAAERLEIIRFQRFSTPAVVFGGAVLVLALTGPVMTLWQLDAGVRILGIALLVEPLWLVQRDVARRTLRTDGLARFAATGVLTAYAWLAASGAMLLAWGLEPGLHYDAVLHAFFIGFVFTAIIAHEPIIVPAVTGLRFVYTPALYLPLILLTGTLALRIAADLGEWADLRRWSAMVQAVAITLFLLLSAASLVIGARIQTQRSRSPRQQPAKLHRTET
jgi:hypothetical protein